MTNPLLGLLSGPIGVGKTTVAARVAELARQRRIACGGLLAPALLDASGRKVGIWAVDATTGERRVLARLDRDLGGPRLGIYSFDGATLAWALGVVEEALPTPSPSGRGKGVRMPPCTLVLVDEIGPLELAHGAGLAPILPRLAAGDASRALILVRESLLGELQARLGLAERVVFRVSADNRDSLPAVVLHRLTEP